MNIFFITAVLLGIFLLSYAWFLFCSNTSKETSSKISLIKSPLTVFISLSFITCMTSFFVAHTIKDTLLPTSIYTIICAFSSGILLIIASHLIKSQKLLFLITLLLCTINVVLLPSDFSFSGGIIPPIAEKAILVTAWGLYSFLYNNMNNCDGVITTQSISVCLGLILMYIMGILPTLYGYYTAGFIVLFIAFNFFTIYPAKLKLNNTDCRVLGFLLGWLCVLASIEGNESCIIILNMYYIYEITISVCKKLTFKSQFKRLENNTFYNYLASSGIAPQLICGFISRTNLMLLLLAGFQIYAPNKYTIIVISFFMVFWMMTRVTSPDINNKHLLLFSNIFSAIKKTSQETNKTTDKDD